MLRRDHGLNKSAPNAKEERAWAVLLVVLTFLGAFPFIITGLRLNELSPSRPLFPLAFAGMELAAFAPTLAAILVTGFFPGGGGVRPLLLQLLTWRVGIAWYAVALIGPMILFLLGSVVQVALGGAPPRNLLVFRSATQLGPGGLAFFIGKLVLSMVAEEPGWRGFAQPRLQSRYGAFRASILIGILWGTWHLWPAITPGGVSSVTPTDTAATYIRLTSTAIIYAWMYNTTKGSLFLVGAAHAGHNLAATLIPIPSGRLHQHFIIALLYLAVSIPVVLLTEPQTLCPLTKGK